MNIFNAQILTSDDVLGQRWLLYIRYLMQPFVGTRCHFCYCGRQTGHWPPNAGTSFLTGLIQTKRSPSKSRRCSPNKGRLDPRNEAGEDGSEGKKQSEKQKSTQQAQEPELNTGEREQLTRNRWETGSEKCAYHTQPAQLRENKAAKLKLTSTS